MKSILQFLALFSALFLATTAGCLELDFDFLTFVNPSVAPVDAKTQAELFGSFIVTDATGFRSEVENDFEKKFKSKTLFYHIGRAGKTFPEGFLHCVAVDLDRKGKVSVNDSEQPCFASKVGDNYILNMPWEKAKTEGEKKEANGEPSFEDEAPNTRVTEWKPENYEGYLLLLLKPTKTGFTMFMLDESFIKSEIAAGRLDGKFMTEQQKQEYKKKRKDAKRNGKDADIEWTPFLVNAKPSELQVFFDKNIEQITGDPLLFLKRVK